MLMSSQMLLFIKHGCKWFKAIFKPWIAKFVIPRAANGETLQFISIHLSKSHQTKWFSIVFAYNSYQFISIPLNSSRQNPSNNIDVQLFVRTIYLNSSQFISIHLNKKSLKTLMFNGWCIQLISIHLNSSQQSPSTTIKKSMVFDGCCCDELR